MHSTFFELMHTGVTMNVLFSFIFLYFFNTCHYFSLELNCPIDAETLSGFPLQLCFMLFHDINITYQGEKEWS